MRRRSAALASISRRLSSIPVLAERSLRPFRLLAASRRRSVVRIPAFLSAAASSALMSLIMLIGYDIKLSVRNVDQDRAQMKVRARQRLTAQNSDELTETRYGAHHLANRVLTGFFPGIGHDLACDALNLPHVQARRH